jgi:general stress protein 26
MGQRHDAFASFVAKDHNVFASLHGQLILDNDRATIDRLWNRFVAAWYPGGKDDPNLQLIRFEPQRAQIWLNANNVFAGIKLLLGRDPKKDYKDKTAEVRLSH